MAWIFKTKDSMTAITGTRNFIVRFTSAQTSAMVAVGGGMRFKSLVYLGGVPPTTGISATFCAAMDPGDTPAGSQTWNSGFTASAAPWQPSSGSMTSTTMGTTAYLKMTIPASVTNPTFALEVEQYNITTGVWQPLSTSLSSTGVTPMAIGYASSPWTSVTDGSSYLEIGSGTLPIPCFWGFQHNLTETCDP